MKAVLYAVKRPYGWEARLSVDWRTDWLYWTSADFRRDAELGWRDGREDSNRRERSEVLEGSDGRKGSYSRGGSNDWEDIDGRGGNNSLEGIDSRGSSNDWEDSEDRVGRGRNGTGGGERVGNGEAWVRSGCNPAFREELVWLKQPLPLGLAEAACAKLATVRQNGNDGRWQASMMTVVEGILVKQGERTANDEPIQMNKWSRDSWDQGGGQAADSVAVFGGERCRDEVRMMGRRARDVADRLSGRGLLLAEVAAALHEDPAACLPQLQLASLLGGLRLTAAVTADTCSGVSGWRGRRGSSALRCRRCGSDEASLRRTACATCGRRCCAYCEACLSMGRSRECGLLVIGLPVRGAWPRGAAAFSDPVQVSSQWRLSAPQQEAALAALHFLRQNAGVTAERRWFRWPFRLGHKLTGNRGASAVPPREFLFWAVTGAGKTEMIFPLLAYVLATGGRVAVATPRKDVVLELAPRLAAAFPDVRQVVLYGGSEDRFECGALTLATTHQLIRFQGAFELVVIDEVDAFPYHNDPVLHHAAHKARAPAGFTVWLSATPPPDLRRRVRWGMLPHARVAVRYHRRPLPVPRRMTLPPMQRWLARLPSVLPPKLLEAVRYSVRRGAQTFLFVPYIRQVEPLVRLLRQHATALGIDPAMIDGTSSRDPARNRKVADFRDRAIRLLVTTTILERGVTIAKSDIFVMEADNPLFDAASLVQMAGRAGRSAADPAGSVYFVAASWTLSQRDACRQIRGMNAYASKKGELKLL